MSSRRAGEPRQSAFRKQLGNILKVVVSAALIIYLFSRIDVEETLHAMTGAHRWWLLAAFAMFQAGFVARALRWRALIRDWGGAVRVKDLLYWYLVGSFFNTVLPTGFGGDVLRVVELTRRVDDPILAANSVVVDRYLGIVVLLGMGLTALPLGSSHIHSGVVLLLIGLFVASLAAGTLLLRPGAWRRLAEHLPFVGRLVSSKLDGLGPTASTYSVRSLAEATAVSVLFNVTLIVFNIFIGLALGVHIPLRYYVLFIPITSVVLMLPSVGGLGVRELSYASLFSQVGVAGPVAVSMSLLVYANTLASGLIGGALYLLGGAGEYLRQLRQSTGDGSANQP